jgi:hypothetical protein
MQGGYGHEKTPERGNTSGTELRHWMLGIVLVTFSSLMPGNAQDLRLSPNHSSRLQHHTKNKNSSLQN